jgi:hypothetical protein
MRHQLVLTHRTLSQAPPTSHRLAGTHTPPFHSFTGLHFRYHFERQACTYDGSQMPGPALALQARHCNNTAVQKKPGASSSLWHVKVGLPCHVAFSNSSSPKGPLLVVTSRAPNGPGSRAESAAEGLTNHPQVDEVTLSACAPFFAHASSSVLLCSWLASTYTARCLPLHPRTCQPVPSDAVGTVQWPCCQSPWCMQLTGTTAGAPVLG